MVEADSVMPGLWDCQTHLTGVAEGILNLEALITQRPQVGAVRAARDAETALRAGFTSVREVGGYGALESQQFSLKELRAIVDEAARADRAVAAHCHGKAGIMAAVEAGADRRTRLLPRR